MPGSAGATGWLNSEPLGPAELRGHVVVVNFWTRTASIADDALRVDEVERRPVVSKALLTS
jgi:hypothetical protein